MDISSTALFSYLLDDLHAAGFSPEGLPPEVEDYWPGASVTDVACLRLYRSFFKKLNDEKDELADERCLLKFMASDERCHTWRLDPQTSKDEELVGLLKKEVDDFLHPNGECLVQSYFDLISQGRAGPGASLGATGVDFYSKFFSSQLSATSVELYKLYNEYACWFPSWVEAELSRSLRLGAVAVCRGNRLSFVRKTRDISRSICTEPSLNMFFQLGLGEIIAGRLRQSFGIDLSTQADQNRAMARLGSIDGSLATIDLESASDSVSLKLCDELFPDWFLTILREIRSPEVELPGGTWHELGMVSSMGNGFTFPLETMIFSCIVRAVARFHQRNLGPCDVNPTWVGEKKGPHFPKWGVFGDDIICESSLADDVCRLLYLCGFRVNRAKSYFVGPFRESCGADFYRGQPVRGVYIRSLRTTQDRYVAINRLNEWSAVTGICLPRTVGFLCDSVRFLAVPYFAADTAGVRTWDPPVGVSWWSLDEQRYVYRSFEPVARRLSVGPDEIRPDLGYWGEPPRPRLINPSGLYLSFLAGYIRNCRIDVALNQGGVMRYRTTVGRTPFWGALRRGSAFAADPCFWTPRIREVLDTNLTSPYSDRG